MKKIALITGASGGIGFEIARLLATQMDELILADIREPELHSAQRTLEEETPACMVHTIACDLADPEAGNRLIQHPLIAGKAIHTLINNAGFGTFGLFAETDWEKESRMLQLHVLTLTHLTKHFLPGMIARGSGKILNVASVAGFQPSPYMAVYNASKAYVLSFSEAIANEVQGTGVTVTVLCPGLTPTGFQAGVGVGAPSLTSNTWISSSPEYVAKTAIRAMTRGKTIAIPGLLNRILANLHRFLPRDTVTALVRKAQEKNRGFVKQTPPLPAPLLQTQKISFRLGRKGGLLK